MSDTYIEANQKISIHREVWRYIPAASFLAMLENESIVLPTAHKYEPSDYNEGRFTDQYVKVVRNFVKYLNKDRDVQEPVYISEDEEVENYLSSVLASREASFISCWTLKEAEDERLWIIFAQDKTGVLLRSTISKIHEEFGNFCDDNPSLKIDSNLIMYERSNMHSHVDQNSVYDSLLPLFFLNSGEESFIHESEYRFIIYDENKIEEISEKLILDKSINLCGSIQLSQTYRDRTNSIKGDILKVPVNLENLLIDVRFGSAMKESMRVSILKKMDSIGLNIHSEVSKV